VSIMTTKLDTPAQREMVFCANPDKVRDDLKRFLTPLKYQTFPLPPLDPRSIGSGGEFFVRARVYIPGGPLIANIQSDPFHLGS
jgi:hypothetical protein